MSYVFNFTYFTYYSKIMYDFLNVDACTMHAVYIALDLSRDLLIVVRLSRFSGSDPGDHPKIRIFGGKLLYTINC